MVGTLEAEAAAVSATIATAIDWADPSDFLELSTTSVVSLFGTAPEVGSLDVRDNGVIGSEGELGSA